MRILLGRLLPRLACTLWLTGMLGGVGPLAACRDDGPTLPEFSPGAKSVLFIGNSLTYYNDLPRMVVLLARAVGDQDLAAASVAFPDFALEDHFAQGDAVRALRARRWDFVVMQQGPSSLPENQIVLANGARAFDPLIRAAGGEPVLFMVWPSYGRRGDFPAVRTSYRNAAAAVRGIFAPAGDAWIAAWELDPSLALYGDALHPDVHGSYLAALVILARIRGVDPLTVPVNVPGIAIPEATAVLLQRAARNALDRNPARPGGAVAPQ